MHRFIDPDFECLPQKADRPREPRQETVTFKAPGQIREQIRELARAAGTSRAAVIKTAIASHYEQTMGGV